MTGSISVVVPTYNERDNIPELVRGLGAALRGRAFEILIVDDASPDGTADAVRALSPEAPNLRLLERRGREGLGAALRAGYNAAKNDIIVSMDADLSFDCADVPRLVDALRSADELVLGSRHLAEGLYAAARPAMRVKRWISHLGNAFVRRLTGLRLSDYSANFRAIPRQAWLRLDVRSQEHFFLLEMVLAAAQARLRVREIPVAFKERRHGRSKTRSIEPLVCLLRLFSWSRRI